MNGLAAARGDVVEHGNVLSLEHARERRARREAAAVEPLLTKKQVAEHFAVEVRTIERWVARGMPVAARLWGGGSGAPRFQLSACLQWHESQK